MRCLPLCTSARRRLAKAPDQRAGKEVRSVLPPLATQRPANSEHLAGRRAARKGGRAYRPLPCAREPPMTRMASLAAMPRIPVTRALGPSAPRWP